MFTPGARYPLAGLLLALPALEGAGLLAAAREVYGQLKDGFYGLTATLVREGEFTEPVPGLTVYAQSIDNKGDMHNLFIHQMKSDGSATTMNTGSP